MAIRETTHNSAPSKCFCLHIFRYSITNLVLTETDPAGNTTAYTYDKAGNRTSMTDPRGNSGLYAGDFTIIYEYDDLKPGRWLPAGCAERDRKTRCAPGLRRPGEPDRKDQTGGGQTKYEYTPRNWVKTTTVQGDGKTYVTQHYYDKVGNDIMDPRN